jgi:hypothetical protein
MVLLCQAASPELEAHKGVYRPDLGVDALLPMESLAPLYGSPAAPRALILLHGLNGANLPQMLFEWQDFLQAWKKLPAQTTSEWRLFVFRASGTESLRDSQIYLKVALHELLAREPSLRELNFLAYSHGGLILNATLAADDELETLTRRAITMATVYHGTPVLTGPLIEATIATLPNRAEQLKDEIGLNVYRSRYVAPYREQNWDNFDRALPASAHYRPNPASLARPNFRDPSKFVLYGGYFEPSNPRDLWGQLTQLFTEQIPELLLNEDAGLRGLNRLMARPTYRDEPARLRAQLHLNDGVAPLTSALRLRVCAPGEARDAPLAQLFPASNFCSPGVRRLRAFSGLDHFDFRRPGPNRALRDSLAPSLQPRELFDWILQDLFEP